MGALSKEDFDPDDGYDPEQDRRDPEAWQTSIDALVDEEGRFNGSEINANLPRFRGPVFLYRSYTNVMTGDSAYEQLTPDELTMIGLCCAYTYV
jgi:hypothetical protein